MEQIVGNFAIQFGALGVLAVSGWGVAVFVYRAYRHRTQALDEKIDRLFAHYVELVTETNKTLAVMNERLVLGRRK